MNNMNMDKVVIATLLKKIMCKLEIARTGFIKTREIFSNRMLSLESRIRIIKCNMLSIYILYMAICGGYSL